MQGRPFFRIRKGAFAAAVLVAVCGSVSWLSVSWLSVSWLSAAVAQETQAQAVAYVPGVADLPLMPGLTEVAGAGVVFDKPSGRIVETYVQGEVARDAVLDFYRRSLPALGWEEMGGAGFRREGERLRLEFVSEEGPLVLRFSLHPE